ncbi:potassium transporter Trk [candidate division KSB1 bacterium]|nr:potassium transporter Trk [candidate division KSB1 bacterium]
MNNAEDRRLRQLDRVVAVLGALAFAMLVVRYGFPELYVPKWVAFAWSAVLPLGFFLEAMYRLLWAKDPWRYLAQHPLRYLILLMIVLEISGVAAWSAGSMLERRSPSLLVSELYLAIFLFGFVGNWGKGAILANRWLSNRRIPVLALPAITFASAIIAGAALLALPGFHRQPISLLDNLFTSASALCVTGLSVYEVSTALNPLGQAVLALLIQIGGLGTMTTLGMLALWHGGALTLGERVAFSELVGGVRLIETRRLIATVLKVTLIVEAFGTLAFWLLWRDRLEHPILQGAFHAISAFCNAGFALFNDSFASFRNDPPTLIILMMLIILGGAGFPVTANLASAGFSRIFPWLESRPLRQASRAVLAVSGVLLVLGAVLFWLDGWINNTPRTLLEALFQSVTTRTAGFQVESQLRFNTIGVIGTIVLMSIGAAPQSTGGGLKLTVFARLFKRIDPRDDSPSSRWLISFKPFRIAMLLAALYLLTGGLATLLLIFVETLPPRELLFEAFSALGTVGLTRDVTPHLSAAGKFLVIFLMFTGRVLYPTLVIRLIRNRREGSDPVPWA